MNDLEHALALTVTQTWDLDRKNPLMLDLGHGATFTDTAGNSYIDFTSCTGAAPLGIGPETLVAAATEHLARGGGILPGTINRHRTALAERVLDLFSGYERVAFQRTGSCATTAALRITRAATGKHMVLTSGYHGWHDWQLQYQADPRQGASDPRVIDFGYDVDDLAERCDQHRGDLAAVIVSPEHDVMDLDHLETIAAITRDAGALMIVDEVMTGFRVGPGGLAGRLSVTPDITVVSKGLANGTALSAALLTGRAAAAHESANLGNTYMRETTPFVVGLAGIDLLVAAMPHIHATTAALGDGLNRVFTEMAFPALAMWSDGILHLVFADPDLEAAFYHSMTARGHYLGNGGTILPSAAVTTEHVDLALTAARDVINGLATTATASEAALPGEQVWPPFVDFCARVFHATPDTAARWWATKVADVRPAVRQSGTTHASGVLGAPTA